MRVRRESLNELGSAGQRQGLKSKKRLKGAQLIFVQGENLCKATASTDQFPNMSFKTFIHSLSLFFLFLHLVNIIEHFLSVKGNLIFRSSCACPHGAFKLIRKIVCSENLTMTIWEDEKYERKRVPGGPRSKEPAYSWGSGTHECHSV